jgi:hypothetical protein
MLSIKDYINLNEIQTYLFETLETKQRENNGFSNEPIEKLKLMTNNLSKILDKLRNED